LRKRFAHKSLIQRSNNASWLISYFDVAYCFWLYGLSALSNRHAALRKLCVSAKTEIWNSYEYQLNVKIWKL